MIKCNLAGASLQGEAARLPRSRSIAAGVAAVLAGVAGHTPVLSAQQAGTQSSVEVEEVVVTGRYLPRATDVLTRAPVILREIPNSISILSGEVLGDQNINRIDEALDNVAGVHRRSNNRQTFFDRFIVRGVDSNIGFSGALLENGLPGGTNYPADFAIVERVEVIKGPASIIAGGSPPGGLINRVIKQPELDEFTDYSLAATSYGKYRGSIDANRVFGTDESVRTRFVVAAAGGDEYVHNVSGEHVAFAPSVIFDASAQTQVRVTGNVLIADTKPFYGLPIFGDGSLPDIDPDFNFDYTGADGESRHYAADAEMVHQFLDDLTLTAKIGASDTHHDTVSIYAYNYPPGLQANGDTNIYSGYRTQDMRRFAGDVYLTKIFTAGARPGSVTVGATYLQADETFGGGYDFVGSGVANIFNPENSFAVPDDFSRDNLFDQGTDYEQAATYAQVILRPTQRLTVMASGRWDFHIDGERRRGTQINFLDDDAFTSRFGMSYDILPETSVYASYSESFLPQPNAITRSGALLAPEEGLQYEAGIKSELLDKRLLVTFAAFKIIRENVAATDPTDSLFQIGLGEIESEGLELEIVGEVVPGLDVVASYTYLTGEITEGDPDQVGLDLEIPRNKASLWAQYGAAEGALADWRLGVGVFYQDEQPDELLGTTFIVDGYTRVDAAVSYVGFDRMELRLNLENLTDERYLQGPGSLNYNLFGSGRNASLTFTYRN